MAFFDDHDLRSATTWLKIGCGFLSVKHDRNNFIAFHRTLGLLLMEVGDLEGAAKWMNLVAEHDVDVFTQAISLRLMMRTGNSSGRFIFIFIMVSMVFFCLQICC